MKRPEKDYTIRFVREADLESLRRFFVKAYGDETIFQDERFLNWYFNPTGQPNSFMKSCVVGIDKNGEVVSHYGGLDYTLKLHNQDVSFVWGVNAYTLPEWRGQGINTKLVNKMIDRHDMLGIIGMPFEAPPFYKKAGFNIFEKKTLSRFVLNLSERTFDIVKRIGRDINQAKKLFDVSLDKNQNISHKRDDYILEVNKENIDNLRVDFDYRDSVTTLRDIDYLKWRFIDNPYIDYLLIAYVSENKISAYAALRREMLVPPDCYTTRIIDLYGQESLISKIIDDVITRAKNNNDIYIDYSAFGPKFQNSFTSSGFAKLEGEDAALLPQVTSPITNRPNHEFIVLFSNRYKNEVEKLTEEDVFFTRADADRDRLANVKQIERK